MADLETMDIRKGRLSEHVDDVIDGAIRRERIVGAHVLVCVGRELLYERVAGLADREEKIAVRHDTIFRLASVSKTVASAAAVALIESGRLSLDTPITHWLPEFRPLLAAGRAPEITIYHLLTHTAGFDYGFQPTSAYKVAQVSTGLDAPGLSMSEALRRLASMPLLFEPGTAWNYSVATDVLGEIISRATEMSLPEAIRCLVTGPLQMLDTDFKVHDKSRLAVPYVDGMPHPYRMRDPHHVPTAAGVVTFSPSRIFDEKSYPSAGAGMVGTARDFLKLLEAIRVGGRPILSSNGAKLLTSGALPDNVVYPEPGWTFSLGAAVLNDTNVARGPHDQGTWRWGGVYGSDWFVNPARELTVVSFTNTTFEGDGGAFPANLRDAIYYALSTDSESGTERR